MKQNEIEYQMLQKKLAHEPSLFSFTLEHLKEAALELAWPTRCAICDEPGSLVCEACKKSLLFCDPWLACPHCGAPFGKDQCCECNSYTRGKRGLQNTQPFYCTSYALFTEESGSIIRCYKDAGEQRLSSFIAACMQSALSPETWQRYNAITFIPNSEQAYAKRGFDHMEAIARIIANAQQLPLLFAFERPQTSDQRKLSKQQRLENLTRSFIVRSQLHALALPPHILVLDDVMTTGATLRAAASALKSSGALSVEGLTFARVV